VIQQPISFQRFNRVRGLSQKCNDKHAMRNRILLSTEHGGGVRTAIIFLNKKCFCVKG